MGIKAQTIYESHIRSLPEHERLRLVVLITRDLADAARHRRGGRSVLELRGLGAKIWKGIDAQEYVDELRDEWTDRF